LVFQIATDGGFLAHPIQISTAEQPSLTLAPGERADSIVDFTACAVGDEFIVTNDDPAKTGSVLKFVVGALK
jgi:spore coat protein A, manganese oxidase